MMLIINFSKLSKIAKLLTVMLIICGDFYGGFSGYIPIDAQAQTPNHKLSKDHTFSKKIDHFLKCLVKASSQECARIFGKYNKIISGQLDFKNLYYVFNTIYLVSNKN